MHDRFAPSAEAVAVSRELIEECTAAPRRTRRQSGSLSNSPSAAGSRTTSTSLPNPRRWRTAPLLRGRAYHGARGRLWHLRQPYARFGLRASAADHCVYLDLYEPAGIEESLDDDEARRRSNRAEGLAMYLRDCVTVNRVHEEYTRSNHVTKRRASFVKRLVDDLETTSGLHADIRIDMAVRPDRSRCGDEDEVPVADRTAKADDRLQRRA